MRKVSFKKKFIPLLIGVVATTSIFAYSKSSLAEFKEEQADISAELDVEKIDKDTVKLSLDNFAPMIKSLQLSVKVDGDVKFTDNTIKWLVSSDDENLKSNIKISDDKKVMDIFIVSTEALNKNGGKLEICEVDLNKSSGDSSKYKIVPNKIKYGKDEEFAYSYLLSDTNKKVSGADIANLGNDLTLNSAPKLEFAKNSSIIEGKIVISKGDEFKPLDYVVATDDEDGESINSKIKATKNEVQADKVGSYNISYSVEDNDGEISTLDTTVIVEEAPTVEVQKPVINITNKTITINSGDDVNLLDGVKVVDYLGREILVEVSGDYDLNKAGNYTIRYNATDRFGNKADEVTATLVVVEKPSEPEIPENNEGTNKPGETDKPGNNEDTNKPGDTEKPENNGDQNKPVDPEKPQVPEVPNKPENNEGTNKPGETDKPGNNQDVNNPEKPDNSNGLGNQGQDSKTENDDLPKTGQGIYFGITIIIGLLIIGSGIFLFKKKKK